jgi:hypothetical protein
VAGIFPPFRSLEKLFAYLEVTGKGPLSLEARTLNAAVKNILGDHVEWRELEREFQEASVRANEANQRETRSEIEAHEGRHSCEPEACH